MKLAVPLLFASMIQSVHGNTQPSIFSRHKDFEIVDGDCSVCEEYRGNEYVTPKQIYERITWYASGEMGMATVWGRYHDAVHNGGWSTQERELMDKLPPYQCWDISEVKSLHQAFKGNPNTNNPSPDLSCWNTSSVTRMDRMFDHHETAIHPGINNWDVSNVHDFRHVFERSNFNLPLDEWDVSSGKTFINMFHRAKSFNQPLDMWDLESAKDLGSMFSGFDAIFNQPLNDWNLSGVTNLGHMFGANKRFNQPLDEWDTSSVQKMPGVFAGATTFNYPVDKWDVSKVDSMSTMFRGASNFKQCFRGWNLKDTVNVANGVTAGTACSIQSEDSPTNMSREADTWCEESCKGTAAPTDAPTNAPTNAPTYGPIGRYEIRHRKDGDGAVGTVDIDNDNKLSMTMYLDHGTRVSNEVGTVSVKLYGMMNTDAGVVECHNAEERAEFGNPTLLLQPDNSDATVTLTDFDLSKAVEEVTDGTKVDICASVTFMGDLNEDGSEELISRVETRFVIQRTYSNGQLTFTVNVADPFTGNFDDEADNFIEAESFVCNQNNERYNDVPPFTIGQDLRFCVKPTNFEVESFQYDVSNFEGVKCGSTDIALSTDDTSVNTIDLGGADGLGAMTILLLEGYLEDPTAKDRKLTCTGTALFTSTRTNRVLRVNFGGDQGRALQEAADAQADFGFTVDIVDEASAAASVSLVATAMAAVLSAVLFLY